MIQIPFLSKKQQRWMFSAESRGELPKGTAKRWANETPNIKKLPETKEKKSIFSLPSIIKARLID